jgi:hypothetical protein
MLMDAVPVLRQTELDSGVNCLTCHWLPSGQVAARRTIAGAPCNPRESKILVSSSSCGVCHVDAQEDWALSELASQHKECHECHMPRAEEHSSRLSHKFLGGHDEATVRSGARMECDQEGDDIVVRVCNHATGHSFPGERNHRVLIVQVIERAPDGEVLLVQQETIKGSAPFRREISSDRIQCGQTVEVRFPVVRHPAVADVTLLYKLYPWCADHESLSVFQQRVELKEP